MYFLQGNPSSEGPPGPPGPTGSLVSAFCYANNTGFSVSGSTGSIYYPIPLNGVINNNITYNTTGNYFDVSSIGSGYYECNYSVMTFISQSIYLGLKVDDSLNQSTVFGNFNVNNISNSNIVSANNKIQLVNTSQSSITDIIKPHLHTISNTWKGTNTIFDIQSPLNITLTNFVAGGNVFVTLQYMNNANSSHITSITDSYSNSYTRNISSVSASFDFGLHIISEIWVAENVISFGNVNQIVVNWSLGIKQIECQVVEYFNSEGPFVSGVEISSSNTIDFTIPAQENGLALLSIAAYNFASSYLNVNSNTGIFLVKNNPLNLIPGLLLAVPTSDSMTTVTVSNDTHLDERWALSYAILKPFISNAVTMSVKLLYQS